MRLCGNARTSVVYYTKRQGPLQNIWVAKRESGPNLHPNSAKIPVNVTHWGFTLKMQDRQRRRLARHPCIPQILRTITCLSL
ncbi:hypothetical protein CNECB9_650010 [Cupriavidus necator]|uniref:Uncharacterized protein n=1 Tax=Cupriavidus necator TaxID=106590 RepID=A0A1K0J372_CUPNE|nr:hypothetical protein CNECB9_650010 [Cupriavidus necator]